jgi:hypothetical protein
VSKNVKIKMCSTIINVTVVMSACEVLISNRKEGVFVEDILKQGAEENIWT